MPIHLQTIIILTGLSHITDKHQSNFWIAETEQYNFGIYMYLSYTTRTKYYT